ncbi:MAG: hypothetical protein DRH32_04155 [Deltaproteobacteria bacterium]|nr:MAG: hypothetical protein DRH32_04155 [Deltaproteobacteria bacterium]
MLKIIWPSILSANNDMDRFMTISTSTAEMILRWGTGFLINILDCYFITKMGYSVFLNIRKMVIKVLKTRLLLN